MINLSCREQHGRRENELCPACHDLLAYAKARLNQCPYQEKKPNCGQCPIHCYKPDMKEKMRNVMRYAGPRMFKRHPFLAIRHFINGWKVVSRPPRG